ncbi:Putative clathrin assembly protein [Striga hermonthica]|uniref:Clathrin assembly protein n=1 Tax=Striga hermonthica TaxID=68872 RepID=A0A9N7NJB2_STRHE|nr:Putative clathrin assembly protein [Striga hermonthica]
MAPGTIRKAIDAVKDQTSISLAKVTTASSSRSALEVAIVRATRHDEYPPDERHICQILTLTSHSTALVGSCVTLVARRLNKTRNWAVALKTLVLVHRLLSKGNRAYERDIFFSTCRGARFLDMSGFRDARASAWDCSAFVRAYAVYLDEGIEFRMQGRRPGGGEEAEGGGNKAGRPTPVHEMKNEGIFLRADRLRRLLERFLACRPTGAAQQKRIVVVAFYPMVKESFHLYYNIAEVLAVLIERFMQLGVPDMERAHTMFCRLSKQLVELDNLYEWCKTVRIARSSECPRIDKIPQQKLDMMEDFIRQKSSMLRNRKPLTPEPEPAEKTIQPVRQDDIHDVKALPPPEASAEDSKELRESEKTNAPVMGDLLDLSEDGPTREESNELALALFGTAASEPWEAFRCSSGDWETALVESASQLSRQTASLARGMDMLVLDGLYAHRAAFVGPAAAGSASSVVVGMPTGVLALPAPNGTTNDPFAASLAVAPPAYVQMSDMERKQRLLVEEQMMWQMQEARRQVAPLPNVGQQYSFPYSHAGGYTMS